METAKKILYHDDPPCQARLDENGDCPDCKTHPDMQSLAIWHYCPTCDLPLKKLCCPKCKKAFEKP